MQSFTSPPVRLNLEDLDLDRVTGNAFPADAGTPRRSQGLDAASRMAAEEPAATGGRANEASGMSVVTSTIEAMACHVTSNVPSSCSFEQQLDGKSGDRCVGLLVQRGIRRAGQITSKGCPKI